MTRIALMGAGGKMGVRLSRNLSRTRFDVAHIEVSQAGRDRLRSELGIDCVERDEGIAGAEAVILAVPDRLIGDILGKLAPDLPPGTAVIMLDAAAAHAGTLPDRPDLTYFITHPCHPPIFNDETTPEAKADFFGGVTAKQHIVCGLMQGPEAHYPLCEEIARAIYAPVMRAHRCSVEALAILEPAMAETVGATLALALREATDEAIRRGVPEQAAKDFMLGHLTIELAIAFGVFPEGKFSDGALHAIAAARPVIFQDNWLDKVFDPTAVLASVRDIAGVPVGA
jgi:hypothetical protein